MMIRPAAILCLFIFSTSSLGKELPSVKSARDLDPEISHYKLGQFKEASTNTDLTVPASFAPEGINGASGQLIAATDAKESNKDLSASKLPTPNMDIKVEPKDQSADNPNLTLDLDKSPKAEENKKVEPSVEPAKDTNSQATSEKSAEDALNEAADNINNATSNIVSPNNQRGIDNTIPFEKALFLRNEMIMLLLPEDEMFNHDRKQKEKLELMETHEYIADFWKSFDQYFDKPTREEVAEFAKQSREGFQDPDNLSETIIYYLSKDDKDNAPLSENIASMLAFQAVKEGNMGNLKALLDNFPLLDTRDEGGNSLLSTSVKYRKPFIAKYLVKRGVDINTQNFEGQTPFILASKTKQYKIADLLSKAGALTFERDNQGLTAEDYFEMYVDPYQENKYNQVFESGTPDNLLNRYK